MLNYFSCMQVCIDFLYMAEEEIQLLLTGPANEADLHHVLGGKYLVNSIDVHLLAALCSVQLISFKLIKLFRLWHAHMQVHWAMILFWYVLLLYKLIRIFHISQTPTWNNFFRLCVRIKQRNFWQTNGDGESAVQSIHADHHETDDYVEPSMLGILLLPLPLLYIALCFFICSYPFYFVLRYAS